MWLVYIIVVTMASNTKRIMISCQLNCIIIIVALKGTLAYGLRLRIQFSSKSSQPTIQPQIAMVTISLVVVMLTVSASAKSISQEGILLHILNSRAVAQNVEGAVLSYT